ncbi:MAG: 6-carboxytetrahydropterin synthase QueD [Lewinellaceae bacterium]|nr:6-carboxytetrahydropterin synthase QueD [Lewinellaceae bacterium]
MAVVDIYKEFSFDAAHFLPNVPADHKCARMHGHTYYVRFTVTGPIDPKLGWVMDFGDLKSVWKDLEDRLDHRCLNDIEGLENPTAEMIASWIWDQVKPQIPLLTCVEVKETPSTGVLFRGN